MRAFLLDVNVLVAMSWPGHVFHEKALSWFSRNQSKGWATCPLVQNGFVRIISNPAFSPRAVSPEEAMRALTISTNRPTHQFWPDDLPLPEAAQSLRTRIVGHQQITDAYLTGLAKRHRGKLATLDTAAFDLGGPELVEVIL